MKKRTNENKAIIKNLDIKTENIPVYAGIALCGIGGIMMQFDSVDKIGFGIVSTVVFVGAAVGIPNALVKKLNG